MSKAVLNRGIDHPQAHIAFHCGDVCPHCLAPSTDNAELLLKESSSSSGNIASLDTCPKRKLQTFLSRSKLNDCAAKVFHAQRLPILFSLFCSTNFVVSLIANLSSRKRCKRFDTASETAKLKPRQVHERVHSKNKGSSNTSLQFAPLQFPLSWCILTLESQVLPCS